MYTDTQQNKITIEGSEQRFSRVEIEEKKKRFPTDDLAFDTTSTSEGNIAGKRGRS